MGAFPLYFFLHLPARALLLLDKRPIGMGGPIGLAGPSNPIGIEDPPILVCGILPHRITVPPWRDSRQVKVYFLKDRSLIPLKTGSSAQGSRLRGMCSLSLFRTGEDNENRSHTFDSNCIVNECLRGNRSPKFIPGPV
jgi:hypothetical protein